MKNPVAKNNKRKYTVRVKKPLLDRLLDKTAASESCLEWTGPFYKDGYGSVYFGEYKGKASRLAWILYNSADPGDKVVCHTCDNPKCVREDHLYLGTQADNVRDRESRGRGNSGIINKQKTHCPSGHEYTGDNVYVRNYNGHTMRYCKTCQRQRKLNARQAA